MLPNSMSMCDFSTTFNKMKPQMTFLVIALVMIGSCRADTCVRETEDERVYTFGSRPSLPPYSYMNEDGGAVGFFVDVVKLICEVMNRKCVHIIQPDSYCWDDKKNLSQSLNNRWVDVCNGYIQSLPRTSAVGFVGEFAKEPANFIYVKKGSSARTVDDIKNSVIGFGNGWITPRCLEKMLGVTLTTIIFSSYADRTAALENGQVEAMVATSGFYDDDDRFQRIASDPIRCAMGGLSMMVRKDMVRELAWMDEGVKKLKENGDYAWMCNKAKQVIPFDIC